jgi:hypothetical protein
MLFRPCLKWFLAEGANSVACLDCGVAVGTRLVLLYRVQSLFFFRYFSVAQQQHPLGDD